MWLQLDFHTATEGENKSTCFLELKKSHEELEEYAELEGTHDDHWAHLQTPHRSTYILNFVSKSIAQTLLENWQAWGHDLFPRQQFHCLIILSVRTFFLISNLNSPDSALGLLYALLSDTKKVISTSVSAPHHEEIVDSNEFMTQPPFL